MNDLTLTKAQDLDSLVAEVADRFTEEVNQGRSPKIEDYAREYPQIATIIRAVFPALAVLDGFAGHSVVRGSPDPAHPASSIEHPEPGLLGDFRIGRELGRGGMGVVYEAEQISLGRRVALKVLPFAAMLDKQQLARFKNEARAAATLDHPNIVAIFSVGSERGVHYYAMQLIEGRSLAEIIAAMRKESGADEQRNSRVEQQNTRAAEQQISGVEQKSSRAEEHESGSDSTTALPLYGSAALPSTALPLYRSTALPTADTAPVAAFSTLHTPHSTLPTTSSSLPAFSSREYFRAVARLGIQAAEALDHAHQSGVLHRDIKPANLLVECSHLAPRDELHHAERDEYFGLKLWITDFGLARIEADAGLTMTGDILGTLRYMSPEQALAKRVVVDHRSDIYSLGVTLYELLTLQPAFPGDDRQELLRQIAFEEPRAPRHVNPRIPQDLETIVLKSIEKNPSDRYSTAQEFADDLRRYSENHSIRARRPTLWQHAHKLIGRHRVTVSAIAVAAFLVVITATAYVADRRRQTQDNNHFVELSLQAARKALEADQVSEAVQRMTEAQTRIDAEQPVDPTLAEAVATLKSEAERYAKFVNLYTSARNSRQAGGRILTHARDALALYQVMENPRWFQALKESGFPDAHTARVSDDIYELLLLNADQLVRTHIRRPNSALKVRLAAQCREAIDHINKAIAFHPPSRGYYWLMANCSLRMGDTEKEKRLRTTALETPPHDAAELFYINRDRWWGTVSFYYGHPAYTGEEVLKDHREILRLDPTYSNAMFYMGDCLMDNGRNAEALISWYACVAMNPDDYLAVVYRGASHSRLGQFNEAKADYETAIAKASDNPKVLRALAAYLATDPSQAMRDGNRAVELAQKACKLTEYKDASVLDALASAYAETGDMASAVKWSEVAAELADSNKREEYLLHLESFRQNKPWREE